MAGKRTIACKHEDGHSGWTMSDSLVPLTGEIKGDGEQSVNCFQRLAEHRL